MYILSSNIRLNIFVKLQDIQKSGISRRLARVRLTAKFLPHFALFELTRCKIDSLL